MLVTARTAKLCDLLEKSDWIAEDADADPDEECEAADRPHQDSHDELKEVYYAGKQLNLAMSALSAIDSWPPSAEEMTEKDCFRAVPPLLYNGRNTDYVVY